MARSLSFSLAASLLLTLPAILGLVMLPSCMANNHYKKIEDPWGLDLNVLLSGHDLEAPKCLESGTTTFCMQEDCNLVLYQSGSPVWSSDTSGKGDLCRLSLQSDGNLVVYDDYGRAFWSSKTDRDYGQYILVLRSDGNAVIYGPEIWSTGLYAVNIGGVNNSSTAGFAAVNATGEDGKNIAMVVAN